MVKSQSGQGLGERGLRLEDHSRSSTRPDDVTRGSRRDRKDQTVARPPFASGGRCHHPEDDDGYVIGCPHVLARGDRKQPLLGACASTPTGTGH
jgi:hypothetical protein